MDLLPDAPDHRHRLAKVDLSMAGRMRERDEHLLGAGMPLAQVVLDDRVAAGKAVLGPQPLKDPLGRMPLLRRPVRPTNAKIASMTGTRVRASASPRTLRT